MNTKPLSGLDSLSCTLPDGRTLAYAIYGASLDPLNPVIFYFHGFVGSRLEGALPSPDALALSATCVGIDRPGMGLSTYQKDRQILDWPADVLALAAHLRVPRFYAIGISGGAPYALACAKEIPPSKLLGVAIVSGIYPLNLLPSDMMPFERALVVAAGWLPMAITETALNWEMGYAARNPDPAVFEKMFMHSMNSKEEHEMRCLKDEQWRQKIIDATKEGMRCGSEGAALDLALLGNWEFELADVRRGSRIRIWHGKLDENAPYALAESAARLLEGAKFRGLDGQGHMSLPKEKTKEVLKDLLTLD